MNPLINRRTCRYAMMIVLVAGGTAGRTWAGEEVGVPDSVKGLLEIGWQSSADARRTIDEYYASIPPATRADSRVTYAYALALVKLRRDSDAARVMDEVAAVDDPHLGVLRARLWLTMLTKQYDAALIQMERIAELLGKRAADPPAPEFLETAGRLGTFLGFLEGPAEGSVPVAKLDAYRARITNPFPQPLLDEYSKGRDAVKQQHAQLTGQQTQADEDAEKEADAERKQILDAATAEREQIAERRTGLAAQLDKLREDGAAEMASLQAAERPLVEQLTAATLQLDRVHNELVGVVDEIARLTEQLRRTRDPERRRILLIEIDRLERIAGRIRVRHDELEREAGVLEARVLEVRRQAEATRARYAREVGSREKEQEALRRREVQLSGMEQRARKLKGDRGKSRALSVRAAALTTYASFALEEEKQRLLQSL